MAVVNKKNSNFENISLDSLIKHIEKNNWTKINKEDNDFLYYKYKDIDIIKIPKNNNIENYNDCMIKLFSKLSDVENKPSDMLVLDILYSIL